MKRRDFIAVTGGAAASASLWPIAALAQQSGRMRRVGVLMLYAESDREGQLRAQAFREGLEASGWKVGTNLLIDFRWGVGDLEWIKSQIAGLMKFEPEVVLANSDQSAAAMQSASRSLPIVFIGSSDPVAEAFVQSLAHPGGNMTGFTVLEPSLGPKWIELLKEIAPRVRHIGVLFNPANSGSMLLSRAAAGGAKKLGVEVLAVPIFTPAEIEDAAGMLAKESDSGLILPPDPFIAGHRKLIVQLADRYRIPAIYALRSFVTEGGLISYGISIPELFRQAAGYVDRILRGDKPEDLPVQGPTKFELLINLKTSKDLGLEVPATMLARADEVIE
ncbi:MAG: ABC transporter substrate-binding protein [Alphaproteobacteria bacterium]|nr:MAG: ABC transporter substrate-binding protein [Alphaproteobacteria bacterium]